MSLHVVRLSRKEGLVYVSDGKAVYQLPYGVDRMRRGWTEHVLTALIGRGDTLRVLMENHIVEVDIPDKKIGVLLPKEYHIPTKPSLWVRFRNFFQL